MVVVMHHRDPDFWRNLRSGLVSGSQWVDRVVVLAYAAATGLVVVGFTWLTEAASDGFERLRRWGDLGPWLPLLWTPALGVALLWLTRRYAWGAMGSGIPQVVLALEETTEPEQRARLVSLPLSLQKMGLVAGGLLAGLSIGREGPTVQVGAGVMQHAERWLSPRSGIDAHDLMVAGAAAGIAAAFNTPLGVIFALEQLSLRRSMSGLVAVSMLGNFTYFGELKVQQLQWSMLGPGLLVPSSAGSGACSRGHVASTRDTIDRIGGWRRQHPFGFAATCAAGGCGHRCGHWGCHGRCRLCPDACTAQGTGRFAIRLHGVEVLCDLVVRLDRFARRCVCALVVDRCRHRTRRGGAHRCRWHGHDTAHCVGHGRVLGGNHARPYHGLHHRHGDGVRPRDGAESHGRSTTV